MTKETEPRVLSERTAAPGKR